MKKFVLLTALSVGLGLNFGSWAVAQERFVRKPLPQPDFFVPKKDVEYQEKLPPFNLPEPKPVVDNTPEPINFQPVQKQNIPQQELEFNPNLDVNLETPPDLPNDEETPKYKQEYNAYLEDLNTIAQTGQAPKNIDLENDLSALSNDARLDVNDNGIISPQTNKQELINPMAFAQVLPTQQALSVTSDAEIIDSVEVINLPESLKKKKKTQIENDSSAYSNPFAQAENLNNFTEENLPEENFISENSPSQPISPIPEVAAHFRGGSNPFAPQSTNTSPEPHSGSLAENTPEPTLEEPAPVEETEKTQEELLPVAPLIEPQRDDEPKVSRNMGRRSRSSSNSSGSAIGSGASFGLGPNMVR